jgi:hypothetical protein
MDIGLCMADAATFAYLPLSNKKILSYEKVRHISVADDTGVSGIWSAFVVVFAGGLWHYHGRIKHRGVSGRPVYSGIYRAAGRRQVV